MGIGTKRNLILVASAFALVGAASADQVINDDLIVTSSNCVGTDCVNGENFGFDTIRLKENNLRIRAFDTSNSGSFPTRDWQLVFNDTNNGGMNHFSVEDIDGGRTPFTIEAGAPTKSLYVDDGGRVGLGTNTPSVELHVVDGDSPTLRLEQDGSSGFTPQTWDVVGNETNFFIRDATNGSKLPFRVRPSAPSNSIYVDTDGDVGLGTASPSARLDVVGSAEVNGALTVTGDVTMTSVASLTTTTGVNTGLTINGNLINGVYKGLRLNNTGGNFIQFYNSTHNDSWFYQTTAGDNGNFIIKASPDGVAGVTEFILTSAGNLTLAGTLTTSGVTCTSTPCDGTFQDDFEVPSIEEHAEFMWENSYLKAVGSTRADQPFNMTEKTIGMLHELEVAHIYIEQLHKQLKQMSARVEALEAR